MTQKGLTEIDHEIVKERNVYKKVFKLKNGHYMLYVCSDPIHYYNESKSQYEEIKCQFHKTGRKIISKIGKYKIILPNTKNSKLLTIKKDNCFAQIQYLGNKHSCSTWKKKMSFSVSQMKNINNKHIFHFHNSFLNSFPMIRYSNVEDGIDLEFIITNRGIKNNIIIRKSFEKYDFRFNIYVNSLAIKTLNNNKELLFLSGHAGERITKKIVHVTSPIMIDFSGSRSDDIFYSIKENNIDDYCFSVKADNSWINNIEKQFPVVISFEWIFDDIPQSPIRFSNTVPNYRGPLTEIKNISSWGSTLKIETKDIPKGTLIRNAIIALREYRSRTQNHFICSLIGGGEILGVHSSKENYGLFVADIYNSLLMANNKPYVILKLLPALVYGLGMSFESPEKWCDKCIQEAREKAIGNNPKENNGVIDITPCNLDRLVEEIGHIEFEPNIAVYVEYSCENNINDICSPMITISKDRYIKEIIDLCSGDFFIQAYDIVDKKTDFSLGHCFSSSYRENHHLFGNGWSILQENNGNNHTLPYDENNIIKEMSNDIGICVTFSYSSKRLTSLSYSHGKKNSYTYDSMGELRRIRYSDGTTIEFSFNSRGLLSKIKSRDNTLKTFEYLSNGRIRKVSEFVTNPVNSKKRLTNQKTIIYHGRRSTSIIENDRTITFFFDRTGIKEYSYIIPSKKKNYEFLNGCAMTTIYQIDNGKTIPWISSEKLGENNLIENGKFDDRSEIPWQLIGTRVTIFDTDEIVSLDNYTNAYRIIGIAHTEKYLKQKIFLPSDKTNEQIYVFSAWAMANSITPCNKTKFEIRAEVYYKDGHSDVLSCPFDYKNKEWQLAVLPIVIKMNECVSSVIVYLDYSHNNDICLFSNVRFVCVK